MTLSPTPPLELPPGAAVTSRLDTRTVEVGDATLNRLRDACTEVDTDERSRAESGRDWWPLALRWATRAQVPSRPAVVARPRHTDEVSAIMAICAAENIPVTAAAGRSGVCGGSVPVFGGVALDLCGLGGLRHVDDHGLTITAGAGTFGPDLESTLNDTHGLTLGHWPQSMALSTVGGWLACRSAGQYSTRYGKIEDMVRGLEVVLADGSVLRTGGRGPRSATGPDLTAVFVGSEGTLGVITEASLLAHRQPPDERRAAWGFSSFAAGLEACRKILRRGATPAVLRLYDEIETKRNFAVDDTCALIVLDEGDAILIDAVMAVVTEECRGASVLEAELVERWLGHRNDVSALGSLYRNGIVVDTMEIAAPWSALPSIYADALSHLRSVDGVLAASAHQSHAYGDGACLYFTFAGRGSDPDDDAWAEAFYQRCWSEVMAVVLGHGGAISHHHGIGLVRSQYLSEMLGSGFGVLQKLKRTLDPSGILNPGKLGLGSPFGPDPWP